MLLCHNCMKNLGKSFSLKPLLMMVQQLRPEAGAKPLPTPYSPPHEGSDKSDDSLGLNKEVSRSLTGSRRPDVADSVTKRRSQMGLADTNSASDTSLKKLWDNGGDITSRSYAEREVEHRGGDVSGT